MEPEHSSDDFPVDSSKYAGLNLDPPSLPSFPTLPLPPPAPISPLQHFETLNKSIYAIPADGEAPQGPQEVDPEIFKELLK